MGLQAAALQALVHQRQRGSALGAKLVAPYLTSEASSSGRQLSSLLPQLSFLSSSHLPAGSNLTGDRGFHASSSHAGLQNLGPLASSLEERCFSKATGAAVGGSGERRAGFGSSVRMLAVMGALPLALATVSMGVHAKEAPEVPLKEEVVLYQYDACPFCNKVKAYLDYYSIPYRVVEVNPWGKKELAWSEYKKVPVVVVEGEQLNDSSAIISALSKRLNPTKEAKKTPAEKEEEEKWAKWVDEHLVHLLSPNIYRSPSEALEAFDYISKNGNFTWWERGAAKYGGAGAMYFISKKLKKKYNIVDERKSLYEAADEWVDAVGPNRPFLGGSQPNHADLAVFGVLRPIMPLVSGRDLLQNSRLLPWYQRMVDIVGESSRLPATATAPAAASAASVVPMKSS